MADSRVQEGGYLDWLFGLDPNDPQGSLPSVAHMLHFGVNYTSGCPAFVRGNIHPPGPIGHGAMTLCVTGIMTNTWKGTWDIEAWNAHLDVTYYWTGGHYSAAVGWQTMIHVPTVVYF